MVKWMTSDDAKHGDDASKISGECPPVYVRDSLDAKQSNAQRLSWKSDASWLGALHNCSETDTSHSRITIIPSPISFSNIGTYVLVSILHPSWGSLHNPLGIL